MDISVIIATHNRAEALRQTLQCMASLALDGLSFEIVAVDNNSTDRTKEVILSFMGRMPIRYLFEPKPGKNCALNRAIAEGNLGRIVVFTDDDISPSTDWLQAIMKSVREWPDHSVFGGRIYVIWPGGVRPPYAEHPRIASICFAAHDYGSLAGPNRGPLPCGGNFWVRRGVLEGPAPFNEELLAWRPQRRLMGSETAFLKQLADKGHAALYWPHAVVGHRVQAEMLSPAYVRRRMFRHGRSVPHANGHLSRQELFAKHPWLWRLLRAMSLGRWLFLYPVAFLSPSPGRRVSRSAMASDGIGYETELLRLSFGSDGAGRRDGTTPY